MPQEGNTFEVDLNDGPVLERPPAKPGAVGEGGKPVVINDLKLSKEEKGEKDRLIKKYQINHFISDKISLHRTPGDHRQAACHNIKTRFRKKLT